jgi:hypothetical protein
MNRKKLFGLAAAICLAGAVSAQEDLVLTATVTPANPATEYAPGEQFTVSVSVTTNTLSTFPTDGTGIPGAAVLEFSFDTSVLSIVSASGSTLDGAIGDATLVGPEEGTAPNVTVDIPTFGNLGNTIGTPAVMDVVFEVESGLGASVFWPFSIGVALDSETSNSLIDTALIRMSSYPSASISFDNAALQGLEPYYSSVGEWMLLDQ